MSHIPSTDAEWITVAWLLRRALWTGRPLGPLEADTQLFERAEAVMDIADGGPALWKLMVNKINEVREADDERDLALACLWDEVRRHSGEAAAERVRAVWRAKVQTGSPEDESSDAADEMFSIIEPLLPPVSPKAQKYRTIEVWATLNGALHPGRERARITTMVQGIEAQLHQRTRALSALYPSAVAAVLASEDAALCQALLIDFATDDGQSRHNAMGGQFPDLQDDLRAIHQPRVKVSHADTPHG